MDSNTASPIPPITDTIESSHSLPTIDDTTLNVGNVKYSHRRWNEHLQTIVSMTGNVLEWYDFAVFGYFSDILGTVFFPPQIGNAATIESFAVFWGAFLMRPVGGLMLGYIGDTRGRKKALEISMFLMAIPTFSLGCLPSYASVGEMSTVLLIIVRMVQGLSAGGQLVSSIVYLVEPRPKDMWGWYGSFSLLAANFGTLVGGLVATLIRHYMNESALTEWGWRIPFLSGVTVSLCGIYLRYYCEDDCIHRPRVSVGERNPIKLAFSRGNRRSLLSATLVPMLWSSGFYLSFVWMAIFMRDLVSPPILNAFALNSASLFFSLCLFFPFAGRLSDLYGRLKVMLIGGITLGVVSPFMIRIISGGKAQHIFIAQSVMGISLSLWGSPMCAWMAESFPRGARLTSIAIGYNTAQAVIGGSSPAVATYLVDTYGVHSPGYLLSAIAVLSVGGLLVSPRRTNSEIESIETSYEHVESRENVDIRMTVNGVPYDSKAAINSVNDLEDFEEAEGTFTID